MLVKVEQDLWLGHCKDDPVRPHLPLAWRIKQGKEVYALFEDQYAEFAPVLREGPRAIICVAYTNGVAITEQDLDRNENANTAMFYTVWSYEKGAGREIVNKLGQWCRDNHFKRLVTLSPLTPMATHFHISNGAKQVHINDQTQNFEYKL